MSPEQAPFGSPARHPLSNMKKKKDFRKKKVIKMLDTMVRTGHAIIGQAQFKGRRMKEEDTKRQRHSLLDPNPRSVE